MDPGAPEAQAAAPAGEWTLAKIVKRGRVTMGTIEASAAGTVAWTAAKQAEVKRGAVVGRLTTRQRQGRPDRAEGRPLHAHRGRRRDRGGQGAPLASIVYIEGFIQATVDLATPFPAWACEVGGQEHRSDRALSRGDGGPRRRASGLFITATTDPLWFDTSTAPELRLAAAP